MVKGKSPMEGVVVNLTFWNDKRVFLTGHTGFKGSWLSLWLQSLGAEVCGYALKPPTIPSLFVDAKIAEEMISIEGNVLDANLLNNVMVDFRPEIVIHMAAQSQVRYSYDNPVETYATNVMGTVNLFEAVRKTESVRAVVNVTTDKCYENFEWDWGYRENDPLGGYDPYSNSKACSELITDTYRRSFFNTKNNHVGIATVRAGNVIGGGDRTTDRLVPDIFDSIQNGKTLNIRNRKSIRPWQHVLEPLRGYLTLSELLYENGSNYSEAWNFGPNQSDVKTVEYIVNHVRNLMNHSTENISYAESILHEARNLSLDISKVKNRLGWAPKLSLEDALDLVVSWEKARVLGEDMKIITLDQIANYQA